MSSNNLFQIPFTERNGIVKRGCHDCLFHVLTALGLRSVSTSNRDSKRIYNKNSNGVEVQVVANYLSTIFNTKIITKFYYISHLKYQLKHLKNDYATFIYGDFRNIFLPYECFSFGHFFIIYKKNDRIYYYDPQNDLTTENINYLHDSITYIRYYISYHNVNECEYPLIKSKLNTKINIELN